MLHFQKSSLINAPIEVVWQFHERPDILQRLTPPWQPVQVIRHEGGLAVGAVSEFRLWLGPIPIKWVAVHTDCVPYQRFTDQQKVGPMDAWTHRHLFDAKAGQTRLTDAIDFAIPGGWLAELVLGWWVTSRLEQMFEYRHQVTQDYCGRSTANEANR